MKLLESNLAYHSTPILKEKIVINFSRLRLRNWNWCRREDWNFIDFIRFW